LKKSAYFVSVIVVLAAMSLVPACSRAIPAGPKGHLFIVGGGERDEPLMKRFVELAKGFGTGRIVVFTMASSVPLEVGPELVAEFRKYGVQDVVYIFARKPQAFKPGDEWHPERSQRSWRSGGKSGIIWLWPDTRRVLTRSIGFNIIWCGSRNIGSEFFEAK